MARTALIRVLLVDDHFVVRVGLAGLLKRTRACKVVAEAGAGAEAVEQYLKHRPDVMLLDRRLPDIPGEEVVARVRQADAQARVIMLSIDEGEEDIHRSLAAGALGYLPKSVGSSELLEAIEAVLAGKVYVAKRLRDRLEARQRRPALSPRELDVLRHIVEGGSNREIAVALGLSEDTVKVHVSHILQKLAVEDRTRAVTTAIARGIVHLE
jgi:DNA-binding NarL/FixJ family response regulator